MTDFTKFTSETATDDAKPILEGVENGLGFVPNLIAYMAGSPPLAKGYTTLSSLFEKTGFTPTERQIVLLTVSRENSCHYCMAAHTSIAQMQKIDAGVIRAVRDGTVLEDHKLESLRAFTQIMVEKRGFAEEGDVAAFLNVGYTHQHILDIVLGIGLKVLSNYTNHIVDTELDDAFSGNAWQA